MASDEEDDYMNMTFGEEQPPKVTETSLQRRQRLKREGEIKARVKSKEEQAADDAAAREEALSRSMLETAQGKKSKGFAMLSKMGFKGGPLGSGDNEAAKSEPIRPIMKEDRGGIGLDSERKRKINEAAERDGKKVKADEGEYRDRVRREKEQARWEKQLYAAQKVAEKRDEEREADLRAIKGEPPEKDAGKTEGGKERTLSTRPLKSINVLWRGLVRKREEAERDRRMRYDLEQSLSRLPTYQDDSEDENDRKAMGKTQTGYIPVEDLEEEDPELEEFDALEVDEKLRRAVEYLRKEYRYCFWCKYTYPDETMDGCPGLTEEDHD